MTRMTINRNETESIDAFFNVGTVQMFNKGDVIIQGDEKPEGVYLLQTGYVKAYSLSQLGQQNLLLIHGANEILPLPWALDGPQKLGIFYEALTDITVLRTSKSNLRAAMGANAWLTEQILRQLVNTITVYANRIQSLGYRLPRERVISCLLDLANRFGDKQDNIITIKTPITHQDIADSINITRETASRVLEQLFQEKLLKQRNHDFIIIDEEKLEMELN